MLDITGEEIEEWPVGPISIVISLARCGSCSEHRLQNVDQPYHLLVKIVIKLIPWLSNIHDNSTKTHDFAQQRHSLHSCILLSTFMHLRKAFILRGHLFTMAEQGVLAHGGLAHGGNLEEPIRCKSKHLFFHDTQVINLCICLLASRIATSI